MPSDTIWSSASTSPIQSTPSLSTHSYNKNAFKSVLDQVDPDVARFLSNSNPLDPLSNDRRFSFNDGSDIDDDFFGLKRGALSAITAPVGGASHNHNHNHNHHHHHHHNNSNTSPVNGNRINFGTASISGGIASRHPPSESFLQKFSNVADATREIELGKLSLDGSRRTSFNNNDRYGSGSLNENLNMPVPRTSRHQSISEKIDNYNNNSPIQGNVSINGDIAPAELNNATATSSHVPQTFWNPAAAASFTPNNPNFMENGVPTPPPAPFQNSFYRPQQQQQQQDGNATSPPPPMFPPFMIPSPPPQMMDPMFSMMYGNFPMPFPPPMPPQVSDEKENEKGDSTESSEAKKSQGPIGVGLMNRQFSPAAFMLPFNPYMYQQAPPNMPDGLRMASPPPGPPPPPPNHSSSSSAQSAPPQSKNHHQHLATGGGATPPTVPPSSSSGTTSSKKKSHKKPFIYRSPLLEEVRANQKEYSLKDIFGHGVEFTKDQHGSRFIQTKLPQASDEEKEVIFKEICDISFDLMTDVFGNYVMQKYFEFGSSEQKQILLQKMLGHIYELSLQTYGCRVVQRALESLQEPDQLKIICELKEKVLVCATDQNSNHVIQKSIELIDFDKVRFIMDVLQTHFYHLCTDQYGCRVVQRLIHFGNNNDKQNIYNEIKDHVSFLITHKFGNYVIQACLENSLRANDIFTTVAGKFTHFATNKYASNVCERLVDLATQSQIQQILEVVMQGNELERITGDEYGNYVVQKIVSVLDGSSAEKKQLVVKLQQLLARNNSGKKSVEKILSLCMDNSDV
ncbi:PUF3 [Candida margitis]|uniref:PUF3 n=1 Tax=Candida margitis TaxID=1775924 RepID=UPI0022275D3D|nr:PUF3 [Candida margitis]KAI5964976.1 PUF3 [Candida margitis]